MGVVADARKTFRFRIEIDGINEFYIQEVKRPDVEIEKTEHGGTNYNIKTAGGVKVGDAELKKIIAADTNDDWANKWLTTAQDMNTGTGGLAVDYKKEVIFRELDTRGRVIDSWLWSGCWVFKTSHSENKRGAQQDNVIETVSLSVDRVQKL